jgi:hypothetical protein
MATSRNIDPGGVHFGRHHQKRKLGQFWGCPEVFSPKLRAPREPTLGNYVVEHLLLLVLQYDLATCILL